MKHLKWTALLTVLALSLFLLAGCGKQDNSQPPAPAPTPAADETPGDPAPPPQEETVKPAQPAPAEEPAVEEDPAETAPVPPAEPALAPAEEAAPAPAPKDPEPVPESTPEPASEPEPESIMAGSTYTISVALAGGSGRATVDSPAKLRYDETGKCWATIVWSSPNFDYMKVDGQRYDLINTEGNSTFEIPVAVFDQPLPVIADTVAMSEPHEVEYTLTFDSASMQDA